MKIFHNHLGYNLNSAKKAIINSPNLPENLNFQIKSVSGETKYTGAITFSGKVDQWKDFNFHVLDFSSLCEEGLYYIEVNHDNKSVRSDKFKICANLIRNQLLPDIATYFKAQRSSGRFDKTDYSIPFFGKRKGKRDVHGGWYDASGDMSKYLSHLSYANFMNPQHIPMSIWNFLESAENSKNETALKNRMIDEAVYGADFLVRMQDNSGYFYQTVFDGWSKDLTRRMICSYSTQKGILSEKYQAGFRQGGGTAIAALARVSALKETFGDYSSKTYYSAAEKGFLHLQKHNLRYLPNGEENIIDDYCALLAACELYRARNRKIWYEAAVKRTISLCGRLNQIRNYTWWTADNNKTRPFYHAADAGLPVISLLRFYEIADDETRDLIRNTVKNSLQSEMDVTSEVNNPFGYARQVIKPLTGEIKSSFFIPHENETGYWWQGENARLASLSSAALTAIKILGCPEIKDRLQAYAADQINWILGMNPFDICMIHGKGKNNPDYVDFLPNISGGICNGITSGFKNENDIDFLPTECQNSYNETWRWSEQWIPHASWMILAASLIE
ncbi:MAG: glycoside hydrolase family 9 protein [Spirochaetes bacterium]|nr:glycoside hydrolase family 9 protein [Spirochaetota bacterium]